MVKIASSLVLIGALTASAVSASASIKLQARQSSTCDAICEKVVNAVFAIEFCGQPYQPNKKLPLSSADAKEIADTYNRYATVNCGSECTEANKPFISQIQENCPSGYLYELPTNGSIPATALIVDFLAQSTQLGTCTKTSDGSYCQGDLMVALYQSFTTRTTVDADKYKAAVCSECVKVWMNNNYQPIKVLSKTIDTDEVNKICGASFLKGSQTGAGTTKAVATSTIAPAATSTTKTNGGSAAIVFSVVGAFGAVFAAIAMFTIAAAAVSASSIRSSITGGPISIALLSDLESRQSTTTLSLQPSLAKAAIDNNCTAYSVRKSLPLSDADAKEITDGFNRAAAINCGSKCTTAGTQFATDVTTSCPAGYVYSFEGTGVAAADLVKDRIENVTKTGICTKTADGNYCLGNVMSALFKSVNTDQTPDAGKYKAAVCQECLRVWVNANYTPIEFNKNKIDAAEVNRVCGVGFLKGQPASGASPSVAFSAVTAFGAVAAAIALF
ncbi:hypothetical protein BC829DRAFT_487399 [Chytridium lagenaria]|nr:hypothetical protein BC829DRAFT_487399 [Chytridium lagenaria]